jgi:prepilin-type N-terminal cleavage/methylation domain-containing protein
MKKGFTLLEFLIVVVVIAVLATLAVPQYIKAVERSKQGKARHALALIAQAEKMYRGDNDIYINVNDGSFNSDLGDYTELAEVDSDIDWDYAVGGATNTGFTVTATRVDGPNSTETVTLTQDGAWGGTFTP